MNRPVRILHIFSEMNAGGAELRTLDVMRRLDRAEFAMDFCVLSDNEGILADQIRSLRGEVYTCSLTQGFAHKFKTLLREGHYDVVHSHVFTYTGYILRLAAQCKVPVRIAHFRSMGDGRKQVLRRRVQHYLMRSLINRHATHILSVSKGAMDYAWKTSWQNDDRCKVIYNGIDLRPFQKDSNQSDVRQEFSIPAQANLYVHVGRFHPSKNHLRLISIFSRLHAVDNNAYLLLVGVGGNSLERSVREMVKSLGLEQFVVYAGYREDIPRLLKASDLMIFPSVQEGLPGSILEASAADIPVVASDLPGIVELAQNFDSVRCLPLSADDSAWVAAINDALKSTQSVAESKKPSSRFPNSDFDLSRCVKSFCSVWETCN